MWLAEKQDRRERGGRAEEEGSAGHAENIILAKVPVGFHGLVCCFAQLMQSIKISRLFIRKAGVDFPKKQAWKPHSLSLENKSNAITRFNKNTFNSSRYNKILI